MPNVKLENIDSVLRENWNQITEIATSIRVIEEEIKNKRESIRILHQDRALLLREREKLVNEEPAV